MNWLLKLFSFLSRTAKKIDVAKMEAMIPVAAHWIEILAPLTVLTPNPFDDMLASLGTSVVEMIRRDYPALMDPAATVRAREHAALGVAAEMVKKAYPGSNLTTAITAVEAAFARTS